MLIVTICECDRPSSEAGLVRRVSIVAKAKDRSEVCAMPLCTLSLRENTGGGWESKPEKIPPIS